MQAQPVETKSAQDAVNSRYVLGRLKLFYQQFSTESLASLDEIYTPDIEFRDPVHVINGSLAVKNYLRTMAAGLTHYRICYLDEVLSDNAASLLWEMEYAHPRIKGGRVLVIRGSTFVKFTSRIYYHEDTYDLGTMVYEQIPVLGALVRKVKQRMSGKPRS